MQLVLRVVLNVLTLDFIIFFLFYGVRCNKLFCGGPRSKTGPEPKRTANAHECFCAWLLGDLRVSHTYGRKVAGLFFLPFLLSVGKTAPLNAYTESFFACSER